MESARYDLIARTPLGAKKGSVAFEVIADGTLSAVVSAMGKAQTVQGTYEGDAFAFTGTATTPLGTTEYEVTGTADGTTLAALCKTRKGDFKVTGKRAD